MRRRWRVALPIVGLILFSVQSYGSYQWNKQLGISPRRYYWWSSIRLDSDPLRRNPKVSLPCQLGDSGGCSWTPAWIWIDSGLLAKLLELSALPAFLLGAIAVGGLAYLGVSEVWSFMVVMPLLLFGWFHFVGWLIDRWSWNRYQRGIQSFR